MNFLRSKRGIAVLLAVLLALFLFRPGVHRLTKRTVWSISSALGRRVALDNVRLRVLPRPGFDLEGLVIYDDPSISAEPMVRAQDVTATIRISSLLRGRLEFSTLSATEPSINLVRTSDGHWNLESLLQRAAQKPVAPTGKPAAETRPAFPYLEATRARINFKFGQEKKSYALSDATVALWQESENSWGARLVAEPVRTDFNLTDTGSLRVNAAWQRASQLRETPLAVTLQWDKGQLGQISKLFSGRDRGWRGGMTLTANLSGTPQSLLIHSGLRVDDFHRYDILGGESVRLATQCSARYSTADAMLDDLFCESPAGNGVLRVRGGVGPMTAAPNYDLTLTAEKVPLASALRFLRQAKKDLPPDLTATGTLNAEFRAQRNLSNAVMLSGDGAAQDVLLVSNGQKDQISLAEVPFTLVSSAPQPKRGGKNLEAPAESYLRLGPFPIEMGGALPATADGAIALSGYHFSLRGDTTLKSLFRLADMLGVPGFRPAAQGAARVDLAVAGNWQGFAAPETTGTAQLHNVRVEVRGLNTPIGIASAAVTLRPDTALLEKIVAQTGNTHWTGKVTAPRPCPIDCVFQADLAVDQLSTADLHGWFTPQPALRPWYRILSSTPPAGKSPLATVQAVGSLRVAHLKIRKLAVSQLATQFDVDRGKITLTGLHAQLLQGTHRGDWVIQFPENTPEFHGRGSLQGVSLAQVSDLMGDPWASGTAAADYRFTASGKTIPDLMSHVEANLQFSMQNGALSHLELTSAARPFPVHRFSGELKINHGGWELRAGKLESRDGIYQVSGTTPAGGGMNLMLVRGDEQRWILTGTLAKPHVAVVDRTQARTVLKP